MAKTTITIERREDKGGRKRFGYVTPGVLRPGVPSRSLGTWSSRTRAADAARREYPAAEIRR